MEIQSEIDLFLNRAATQNDVHLWQSVRGFALAGEAELPDHTMLSLWHSLARRNISLAVRLLISHLCQKAFKAAGVPERVCAMPLFGNPRIWASVDIQPTAALIWSGTQVSILEKSRGFFEELTPLKLMGLDDLYLLKGDVPPHQILVSTPLPGWEDFIFRSLAHILKGALVASTDVAQKYMRERRQGGRFLIDWSAPRDLLNRMQKQIEVFEALLSAPPTATTALDCFLEVSGRAPKMVSQCMDLMGGAGYMKDFSMERLYRDVFCLSSVRAHFTNDGRRL